MQVFITNKNMKIAAQDMDDLRLNSQIKEIFQLLCAMENLQYWVKDDNVKIGHTNHPVFKNYNNESGKIFLIAYSARLLEEYYYRFGKQHKDFYTWWYFREQYEEYFIGLDSDNVSDCFPVKYIKGQIGKDQIITDENVFELYKQLLADKWSNPMNVKPKWMKREQPSWYFNDKVIETVRDNIEGQVGNKRCSICRLTTAPYFESLHPDPWVCDECISEE